MTREEIIEMAGTMGIYFDADHPDHISEDSVNTILPPFMELDIVEHPIYADGNIYIMIYDVTIRIYSEAQAAVQEGGVTSALEDADIRWKRSVSFNEYMDLFEISYKFQA